jgi:hypothetical protein
VILRLGHELVHHRQRRQALPVSLRLTVPVAHRGEGRLDIAADLLEEEADQESVEECRISLVTSPGALGRGNRLVIGGGDFGIFFFLRLTSVYYMIYL